MRYAVIALLLLAACTPALETPEVREQAALEEPVEEIIEEPQETEPVTVVEQQETIEPVVAPEEVDEPDAVLPQYGSSFRVTAENYVFYIGFQANPDLYVNVGDTITIHFESIGGFHNFVIDEYGATKQVRTGQKDRFTFVADTAGTFDYYCSVKDHRSRGMKGKLIVE